MFSTQTKVYPVPSMVTPLIFARSRQFRGTGRLTECSHAVLSSEILRIAREELERMGEDDAG